MFCVGALPVVGVRPVASVGVVMVAAVMCGRPVVGGRWRVVAAVLPVVVIVVAVMMAIEMAAAVVVVVVTAAVVTTEALTQRKLSGQLSDGLPLVQDGLLLPHQALTQV